MNERDTDMIQLTSQEFRELLADAHFTGTMLAEQTVSWLMSWWTDVGLPTHESTGFPLISRDMLLHARAVTSISLWERTGFSKSIKPHIQTSTVTLNRFVERIMAADVSQCLSDEGARLCRDVTVFELPYRTPVSHGLLDPNSSVAVIAKAPTDDGLKLLAELLLEFSDKLHSN